MNSPGSAALSIFHNAPFYTHTRHKLGQIQILQIVISDFPERLEYMFNVAQAYLFETLTRARRPDGPGRDYLVAGSGRVLLTVVPFVLADCYFPVPLVPLALFVRVRGPKVGAF